MPLAPSSAPAPTSDGLLANRRFAPLFWTQFWGAFNDNLFKNALVLTLTFGGAAAFGLAPEKLVALAGGVFILPFFLFSALAGELADKYSKTTLIRWVKLGEVLVMLLGATAFLLGSGTLSFVVLFLMGLQSTLFGPLKYGALPELLGQGDLVGGNALVEVGTFLAILLGTIAAGVLLSSAGIGTVALAVVIVAGLGYWQARQLPMARAVAPGLRISRGLLRPTWELVRIASRQRSVLLSILGISWFWLLGAVVLSVLPSLVALHLGGSELLVTYLLALFSVGVGAGSLLCKKLSFRQLELGLVPLGSLGMTLFLFDAGLVLWDHAPTPGLTLGGLLATFDGVRLSLDLTAFSLTSGLFIVPLYTLLQERSEEGERARTIAANNVVNAAFMVAGSLLLTALYAAGASIPQVLLVLAALNLAVAAYIYTVLPEFLFRLVCFGLAHMMYRLRVTGREHIPLQGAAVLVCNHVTFVDWLILSSATQRPLRFVMHNAFTRLPLSGRIFRDAKVIPIASAREDAALLEQAFRRISEELRAGELVCLFPEGMLTRDGSMAPFRRGIERIVATDPVPVVPMHLDGLWGSVFSRATPRRFFRRFWSRVDLRIGAPEAPSAATAAELEHRVRALADASTGHGSSPMSASAAPAR
jgi:1-acyl-sn-glycerol-3-phosphate acyltransferase